MVAPQRVVHVHGADAYVMTCRQLHGVAEVLIAGPQHRRHGTIRLAVTPAGFRGAVLSIGVYHDAAGVNYGVSLGDSYHPRPSAYVGLPKTPSGSFGNAPFGALRSLEPGDYVATIVDLFTKGKEHIT